MMVHVVQLLAGQLLLLATHQWHLRWLHGLCRCCLQLRGHLVRASAACELTMSVMSTPSANGRWAQLLPLPLLLGWGPLWPAAAGH
jgi:hypothetical protein